MLRTNTAQKMEFSIKDFFSKCDQIRSFRSFFFESLVQGNSKDNVYWEH